MRAGIPLCPHTSSRSRTAQAEDTQETRAPRLLDRLSEALRARHYSRRTEQTYRLWVRRYIFI
jgi:hypothetical protein